ncbi:Beta-1,3-galactosyltransferase 5-like protein [Aphelenchoides bicaudatus]|nr:Beta-1,3-galactosyltransferase 5-like protein [Aphelenchoides bicaudatus]
MSVSTLFKVLMLALLSFEVISANVESPKLYPKDFGDAVQFHAKFANREWTYEMKRPIPKICGPETKAFIGILSAPSYFDKRQAIRQSWMHDKSNPDGYPSFFFIGHTDDTALEAELIEEQKKYGDIIRYNVVDAYDMLPVKTHAILSWHQEFCPTVPYLLKTDDDTVVYLKRLDYFMKTEFDQVKEKHPATLFCNRADNHRPFRSPANKYFVSFEAYSENVYPTFCLGGSYLVSAESARSLLDHARDVQFLHLEDVLFTGLIARKADVHQYDTPVFSRSLGEFAGSNKVQSVKVDIPTDQIAKAYQKLKKMCIKHY